jgi:hypothetical protein
MTTNNISNIHHTTPNNKIMMSNIAENPDLLNNLINECSYIQECTSNKKRDPTSMAYLIDRDMSQSDCVKFGHGVENVIGDMGKKHTTLKWIRPPNKKGKKEKDHLFEDEINKIIYYSECKTNLNLDTEKHKSTYEKCLQICEELGLGNDYKIVWCLLGARYIHSDEMPSKITKKYVCIKDHLFGINQYLKMLGVSCEFTKETYRKFLNDVANAMFDD